MHYICVFFVFEAKYNNIYACHVTSWSRGPGIHTTYPSHISHPRRAIKVEILVELWYKNCNCDWIRIILSPENDCWFQDYLASRVYWTNHSLNISWFWECIHFFVCGIWQSFHRIYMHIISMCISLIINSNIMRDRRDRGDPVVVGFTSTHAIGALHHHSWWFFWWSLESMRDFFQTLQPQKIKIGVNTVLGKCK